MAPALDDGLDPLAAGRFTLDAGRFYIFTYPALAGVAWQRLAVLDQPPPS